MNSGTISVGELRKLMRYEPDTGHIYSLRRWRSAGGKRLGYTIGRGYLAVNVGNRNYAAHRVAWALHYGEWPEGQIDHINGNRKDNRIANLRDVTPQENMRNQRKRADNASGITGVRRCGSRWEARIGRRGTSVFLGSFSCLESAVRVRQEAERDLGFHENHGVPREQSEEPSTWRMI